MENVLVCDMSVLQPRKPLAPGVSSVRVGGDGKCGILNEEGGDPTRGSSLAAERAGTDGDGEVESALEQAATIRG